MIWFIIGVAIGWSATVAWFKHRLEREEREYWERLDPQLADIQRSVESIREYERRLKR